MDLLKVLQQRYTTKAYDASKVIAQSQFDQLLEVLKLTPSSINIQPWHFFVADTAPAKERIATALVGDYAYNAAKVLNASHTIVFCSKTDIDSEHLSNIITQEAQDGRFKDQQVQQNQMNSRTFYVDYYRQQQGDLSRWTENQTFIALGQLLFAAALQGIDATPIGGFNAEILNQELKLSEQGLKPSVLVALGYRSDQDFNAPLPKSRLDQDKIISVL